MRVVRCLLLCCLLSRFAATCESTPPSIEGLYLGVSGKDADEIQRKAGKILVYGSGMYWYRVVPGPFAFSPTVVFSPDGRIRRIVGDKLEIGGVIYRVRDSPHLLKLNLGLPAKMALFSRSGRRFRELIYPNYKLAVELDGDRQDRIVSFLLDQDEDALYFTKSKGNGATLGKSD